MNGILRKFDEVKKQHPRSKERQIESLLGSEVFDFDQREFLNQLDSAAVYGRRFARYILYKLDMIYGGKSNRLQPPKEISVEHILPQNPSDDSQWCIDFNLDQRNEWTDRLGNLVLISRRKNTAQGRLDYAQKKSRYFTKNIETFPNSLRVLNNASWTHDDLVSNHSEVLMTLRNSIS
jgi:hypothetical protein